jgi:hypothetical protein
MAEQREVLVVRGFLDRAGRFTLRRSRSTPYVRQWPVVEKSDVVIELLDAEGTVLHREPAEVKVDVTCDPGAARRFRVLAYVELRADAAAVRLRREPDLELWRATIPEAPKLRISLASRRARDGRRVELALRYSPPGEGAHLTLVYRWGERRFRPVYLGPPQQAITLSLDDMPGGEECRIVASYSNGLRSAQAATPTFAVPRIGPSVTIVEPARGAAHVAGTPLILEGAVRDEERAGGPPHEALVWRIDGKEVGRGLVASVDALTAGRHRVELAYVAEPGARAVITLTSRAAETPTANDWPAWDPV